MTIQALFEKNDRMGGSASVSLNGIPGNARGLDSEGNNVAIQINDVARIIENNNIYIYKYIEYVGIADDDVYIRPITDPDSSKAWMLMNGLDKTTFTGDVTFETNISVVGDINLTGEANFSTIKIDSLYFKGPIEYVDSNTIILSGKREYVLNFDTTADRIFTIDSMDEDNDGELFFIRKLSDFKLTLRPGDSSKNIWKSGLGYGIEIIEKGYVVLRYDHTYSTFRVVSSGGNWMVEGLVLYVPGKNMYKYDYSAANNGVADEKTERQKGSFISGGSMGLGVFGYFFTKQIAQQIKFLESTDFDIFGSKSGDVTLSFDVEFTSIGADEFLVAHFENTANYWGVKKTVANIIEIQLSIASTLYNAVSTATVVASTPYKFTFMKKGADIGLYLDETQVIWFPDANWSIADFVGNLFFSQVGNDSIYLGGSIKNIALCYQNLFDASPNVGKTDTIDLSSGFLGLTMKG